MFSRNNWWQFLFTFLTVLVTIISVCGTVYSVEYKDYKKQNVKNKYLEISMDKHQFVIKGYDSSTTVTSIIDRKDIVIGEQTIQIGDDSYFEEDVVVISDYRFPYANITDMEIYGELEDVTIILFTEENPSRRVKRIRRGSEITFDENIVIDKEDFMRGFIFSIKGDIEVHGEINKDVVSLFGNIFVSHSAVIRGDVATLTTKVDVAKNASIYGELISATKQKTKTGRRFHRDKNAVVISTEFYYNRVDGIKPLTTIKYEDYDSTLPSVWATGGFAFASERWRWELGLEQVLWKEKSLSIGAKAFRRLSDEDDWLLSNGENTAFALLVTEDFKDYYESEGGSIWTQIRPFKNLQVKAEYLYEETNYLYSHRHLWSLFGGNKLFSPNFNQVPEALRYQGITEIDLSTNAFFRYSFSYDSRDKDDVMASSWVANGVYEYSNENINSDFNYKRYQGTISRYQKINKYATIMLSGTAGGSEGYLPMHKRFYLGGLGTLRGYYHKEFSGTRFWMTNAEYRFGFPHSDIGLSLFYDAGSISNYSKFSSTDEIKQDIGVGLSFDNDFKITLAKRLDSATNKSPKLYVRLSTVF